MDHDHTANAVQGWLKSEAGFAQFLEDGAPVLVLKYGTPPRVVYANRASLAFFTAQTSQNLEHRLQTTNEQGARRLRDLAAAAPLPSQRLERLRFAVNGSAELHTCVILSPIIENQSYLAISVLGLSEQERRALNPAPRKDAAAAVSDASASVQSIPETAPIGHGGAGQDSVTPVVAAQTRLTTAQRFTFQTDGDDKISRISPEFAGFGLRHSASVSGALFTHIAPFDTVAAALTSRQTWRNVEVLWPTSDGAQIIPVTLSGSPVMDNAQKFAGFRGFGVAHFDRAETVSQLPDARHHEEVLNSDVLQDDVLKAAATTPIPAPLTGNIEAEKGAWPDEAKPHTYAVEHALADHSSPQGSPPSVDASTEAVMGEGTGAAEELANVVPLNAAKPYLSAIDQEGAHLSNSERLAFREIARALGARVDDQPHRHPDFAHEAPGPQAITQAPTLQQAAREAQPPAGIAPVTPTSSASASQHNLTGSAEVETETAQVSPVSPAPLHGVADYGLASNSAALLDRLPVGILVSRGEVPIFTNKVFLEMLGYADADQFHAEDGLHKLFVPHHNGVHSSDADKDTMALQSRSGDILQVEAHLQSLNWNGDPASLLAFRRVGEPDHQAKLKKLELELRAREAETRELHDILDTATDGVVVLDDRGNIIEVNRSAEALLGFEHGEVAGQPITVLLDPESHAAAMDYLDGLKSNGVASVLNDGRDVVGRERHGGAVPLFMTLGRVGIGQNAKFCAVLRDVTHWKKAERELDDARRQAERSSVQKSDFLAKISHEIRTPLNAIIGFTEVIWQERFGPIGNERYKDYLKDIHASGMHVMSLVNDLLDLTKIESGNLELAFTSVNANVVIQQCVALMQPQATKARVIIRVSLAPRLPNIVCDERSLKQIVINLLSNAVKFNDPGGQVIVSTALTDAGHAVIRVRDTGIGMNESDVERALEPFRQLDTSRKANGTGLGLPLTKAMVEANRAAFIIKSKRGEGTLVEVMFPPTRVLAE